MMLKNLIFTTLITCFYYEIVSSSCLSVLNGKRCSEIQITGQRLARVAKKEQRIIHEVLFRIVEESILITNSSMGALKKINLQINHLQITPIETPILKQIQQKVLNVAVKTAKEGNIKFLDLLKKGSKISLKDDVVATALLSYTDLKRGRRDATKESLTGIVESLKPEMKIIIEKVAGDFKTALTKLFDVYIESLKILLKGKVQFDFDLIEKNLQDYLNEAGKILIGSHLKHSLIALKEGISQMEIIDGLVEDLKKDPNRLYQALDPAISLVSEVIEDIQKHDDAKELEKKLAEESELLKGYIRDLKKTVT